jgi:hypothetical protein
MWNISKPELLDTNQAAEFLGGISPVTLNTWRSTKRYDLPYVKIGGRVFYRVEDLRAFVESRMKGGLVNAS